MSENSQEINYDFSTSDKGDFGTRRWGLRGVIDGYYSTNPTEEDMKDMPEEFRVALVGEKNYIRASELGKNYWERYQSARGVPSTNPFDARVLQVFENGKRIELGQKIVLRACGIFIDTQDEEGISLLPATEKTVEVRGHYDGFVGGEIASEDKIIEFCKSVGFTNWEICRALKFSRTLRKAGEFEKYIAEFKSINSRVFWRADRILSEPYIHHKLQTYFYLKRKVESGFTDVKEARILYISKDDCVKAEFPIVYPNPELEEILRKDIEEMSYFLINNIEPPKPEQVVFRPELDLKFVRGGKEVRVKGRWEGNWEVARSPYFTALTGFSSVKEWEKAISVEIVEKNKIIKKKYDDELVTTI